MAANASVSQLAAYGTQHGDDLFCVVDVHDASMAASGTDKRATTCQVFGSPANGQLIGWSGGSTGVPVGVTVGSGLTLSGGTLSATGGGTGTVTSVSVASANGLSGTVANPTTTPAITLTTSVTGILKGNGTAISAATAGTDYLTPTGSGAALTGITAGQVSGLAASATTDTTNATNIASGTLAAARGGTGFNGAAAANGQIPIGNGSGFTLANITAGANVTVTNSAGGITIASSGGTASPGGTSGQVQFNNAGALGGFTATGDATINTGTGAVTVTKTNGVAFAASATTDATNAANIASGNLPAARLAGVGSSGQVLFNSGGTAGAGAANLLISSNGLANLPSVADPGTAAAGDLWLSSTSGGLSFAALSAWPGRLPRRIYSGQGFAAVANTAVYTSLLSTPGWSDGSLTIPAGALARGTCIELWPIWSYSTAASAPTAAWKVFLGGTLVLQANNPTSLSASQSSMSGFTAGPIRLHVTGTGVSGAVIGGGSTAWQNSTPSSTAFQLMTGTSGGYSPVTINTTGALAIDIQHLWSAASASNTITLQALDVIIR